jgi:tetratricopeptide (TPR) repeat protein
MMSNCNKEHKPCYNNICCLYQLLLVNEYASNQLMDGRYSNIFLKTLNHHYKNNSLYLDDIKLDIIKLFLEVVSKYSAQYYFNLKLDYSKLLIKIGLTTCMHSSYKNHPEVIERRNAILINLSAVYIAEKNYTKAIKYLGKVLPFASCDLDRAVIHNNLARIYKIINDYSKCLRNLEHGYELYKEEMKNVNTIMI